MNVEFKKAAWRPWLALLFTVPALALALDLTITDRGITDWVLGAVHAPDELRQDVTRAPEGREDGGLSYQGASERRADWLWGAFFWAAGGGLLFWALTDITSPRRALSADETGLRLRVGSAAGSEVLVPWEQVDLVRSTIDRGPTGPLEVLEITVTGPTWVPPNPTNARWDGNRLLVTAHDWSTPAHQVAGVLEAMRERSRVRAAEAEPGPDARA